jgi:hypothetical protein
MIETGFDHRVKIQQVVESHLPEFILDENPIAVDFFKQYYISQEYQGGTVDIAENLDQYLKLDNLTPEVVVGFTTLSNSITSSQNTIQVSTTKGFPNSYGLLKIDDEIITYTGLTTNTFTGCVRGFCGITSYHDSLKFEELIFSESSASSHVGLSTVQNLSSLFLKEFYKKIKNTLTPGLENKDFTADLNVGNFIKESKTLYQTKGTPESFRILFNVLFNESARIVDLERFLVKPSYATFIRRDVVVAEVISGDPINLQGQTIVKSTDEKTTASVSEVELIRRKGKSYYKFLLFVGYDDSAPTVTGSFTITGSTKNIDYVSAGSSTIIVDSTIGFPDSGTIYTNSNTITYTDKSINQFFGCNGIVSGISTAETIYSNETYYGYENGDLSKKVLIRISGVLSEYQSSTKNSNLSIGEQIYVKNVGEKIKNPASNKSYKEIFANSWIYNTSSRYQIDSFAPASTPNGTVVTTNQCSLKSTIDKSSLKVGDFIDVLNKGSQTKVASNLRINAIVGNQITTNSSFTLTQGSSYDIRRKIKTAVSNNVPLEFNKITTDIQNLYNGDDEYAYVASNSFPSYAISKKIFSYNISNLADFDSELGTYATITFSEQISFLTGSEVYYTYSGSPIPGLSEGVYYVQVLSGNNKIRLYASRSVIGSSNYLTFENLPSGTHTITLSSQRERILSPQKILRKFPLTINYDTGDQEIDFTEPGPVGMLINGVEIYGYKSANKIYYGPLESVKILNAGSGYDVINPPSVRISSGIASISPVVSGSVERVFVDPQEFDVDVIVSVAITGGNGRGASFDPILEKRRREISFDARVTTDEGGVDVVNDTITFLTPHGLINGQPITYRPGSNQPLGLAPFLGSNLIVPNSSLKEETVYYTNFISDTTIQLYPSLNDYKLGINTIGFSTAGTSGIHKFATESRKTLTEIKVVDPGFNYTNRKLSVLRSGISTVENIVLFNNHGFLDGDIVVYSNTSIGSSVASPLSGLSTQKQYYVLKLDDNRFQLSDAGIGATTTVNYLRRKPVSFGSTGNGYHNFSYPDISLKVNYTAVGLGSTQFRSQITATPVIKGSIIDAYVYVSGSGYGSTITNYQLKPSITLVSGKNAEIRPIITNGSITDVSISYGGLEYFSTPTIKISGTGNGAILKPVITNYRLTNVIVINGGSGYDSNTKLTVESSGKNALLDPQIRSLTINNNIINDDVNDNLTSANELIVSSYNNLQYGICGYSDIVQTEFNDSGSSHSPIIGWAYDGNPIYGAYGYSNPEDKNSSVKKLVSGYTASLSNIINRPPGLNLGFFVEDYTFTGGGDLDPSNGRYCVTPEFPNGVYAYFATSVIDANNNKVGSFPYFIGDRYKSKFISENKTLDQTIDFNNSSLVRNTFPYKVGDQYADNDFLIESNEIVNQTVVVESVTSSSVEEIEIINSGDNYNVGDNIVFNNDGTEGGGLKAEVSQVKGEEVTNITTNTLTYNNACFTWNNNGTVSIKILPKHDLSNLDYVNISGFSTSLSTLNGFYQIGVTSYTSTLLQAIPEYQFTGFITDISVSTIPPNLSIGSSIGIGTETLSVLNIFDNQKILRVRRGTTGTSHTIGKVLYYNPDTLTINKKVDYFKSDNNKIVYFNPFSALGIGSTPGISNTVVYNIGVSTDNTVSIPTQSIYLPNHPFKTNERVILGRVSTAASISVTSSVGIATTTFSLLAGISSQTVYVIKKSVDFIGLVTNVGLTTNTNGLFFNTKGSDTNEYYIQSTYNQILGTAEKITATVSVSTSHNLSSGDRIHLSVNPSLNIGIGTSVSIRIQRDSLSGFILVNPIRFGSSSINTTNNTFTLANHNLITGDKVRYSATTAAGGLTNNNFYYVYKIDNNTIQLSETSEDVSSNPPVTIDLTSGGSAGATTQNISLVNPPLSIIKNNNVNFDLRDSSLNGYQFQIFYDNGFKNRFVSAGSTNIFSVVSIGTAGVSTNAALTINYNSNTPIKLFYALSRSGFISTADKVVKNYSQINYIDSYYNGDYNIVSIGNTISTSIGSTQFTISLQKNPERPSYNKSDCQILEYKTNSPTATGGVSKIRILSSGFNYKKLPLFSTIQSNQGSGAYLVAKSTKIGNINQSRILNEGFGYASDKTLRPEADVSKLLNLDDLFTIEKVDVLDGGKNYTSSPNLIIIDTDTRQKINSGFLSADFFANSIRSVSIPIKPKGLPATLVTIKAINNSNGVGINSISSSFSGIITCTLVTPLNGFSEEPFSVGDRIFVEGIEKYGNEGNGFNSEDYGYEFFTVTSYNNAGTTSPRTLEFSVVGLGTTSNPGIARTSQDIYGFIINYDNYPKFEVTQNYSQFIVGEYLEVKNNSGIYELQDLKITEDSNSTVKVIGTYDIFANDLIRGSQSGTIAKINNVNSSSGKFKIDYASRQKLGWSDNIGKLSEDTQVISDNNYYQNLSYSIKSKKTWLDIVSPVNKILHSVGLKNFSDTEIFNNVGVGTTTVEENLSIIYDISDFKNVTTIANFDAVKDIDTNTQESSSRFINFNTKKLSNYISAESNRVLAIDDISDLFSSTNQLVATSCNVATINPSDKFNTYLVQIRKKDDSTSQITEVIILTDNGSQTGEPNLYSFERGSLSTGITTEVGYTSNLLGEIYGEVDELDNHYLKFTPNDPYNSTYDIKFLNTKFPITDVGIGSTSVGFIRLSGITSTVGAGSTFTLISQQQSTIKSAFSQIHIIDNITNKMNYYEFFLDNTNGVDTNLGEFYFDTEEDSSSKFIGTFTASLSSGIVSFTYTNTSPNSVTVRSKIVGFGSTALGIGTYRFKSDGQPDGDERTVTLGSSFSRVSTASTVFSYNTDIYSSSKSIIKVSIGSTSALHQVLTTIDLNDMYTYQYPFISAGSTNGIGTFGGTRNGNIASLIFYPDTNVSGVSTTTTYEILSYNQVFYDENDYINLSQNLTYTNVSESVGITKFFGINDTDVNRLNFDLYYQNTPIFMKTFNPENTTVLDKATGTFNIPNHFFQTAEKLYYRPNITFVSVAASSVSIGATTDYLGFTTTVMPPVIWAIRLDNDRFKLAATLDNAYAGIAITFTSSGSGNAHELEMVKKNEKSIISINNIIQSPIAYTNLNYTLDNYGSIGTASTIFKLSGIGSIRINDILKIDDEYMQVINLGLSTISTGPISFAGTFPLVNVKRAYVGSSSSSHVDLSSVSLYRGSYNIVKNTIWFTEQPEGSLEDQLFSDFDNLPEARAYFNGRVFLRKNYSTNIIYDDLSENFNGIGRTYTLTISGVNTSGLGTDGSNGIVLLNGIFQTPTTQNNPGNNYEIVDNTTSTQDPFAPYYLRPDEYTGFAAGITTNPEFTTEVGISSIVFSGITSSSTGEYITSPSDVNLNQVPRGGIIVSLGSTPGLGYAPLVGARVKAIVGSGGTITSIVGISYTGSSIGVRTASYNNITGIVNIKTTTDHGLFADDRVRLVGLAFTCPSGGGIVSYFPSPNFQGYLFEVTGIVSAREFTANVGPSTLPHTYVGVSTIGFGTIFPWYNLNIGSGYRDPVSVAVSASVGSGATITATVGAGGTLAFTIVNPGTGYTGIGTSSPRVYISPPNYENLGVIGVSRLSVGSTTDCGVGLLLNLEVGSASTTGVGVSDLFEVTNFKVARNGYGFQRGDIVKAVGLVTAKGLASPIKEFQLTILKTFYDSFSCWQFGQMDYIDSVKNLQDGIRTRFPLYYNGELVSFEKGTSPESTLIDFDSLLLIFINGVLQEPKVAYQFIGGSSFTFTETPKPEDKISIFFYRGSAEDSEIFNVRESIKEGDVVQIYSNNSLPGITTTQNSRTVTAISFSNKTQTDLYVDQGVDIVNDKTLYWTKQNTDKIIDGNVISKSRDSLEPQIYPTARIIKDFTAESTELWVDNAEFFNYENVDVNQFECSGLVVSGEADPVGAAASATVSATGRITGITITNAGSGYFALGPAGTTVQIEIAAPKKIGVGIGSTAIASAVVSSTGTVTTPTVSFSGLGYTSSNPPRVIVEIPKPKVEFITNITNAQGFSGNITNISTCPGIGTDLAIQFILDPALAPFPNLSPGNPVYIFDTYVGRGVTSIYTNNTERIGIGTTFSDCIYNVSAFDASSGILTCNVLSTTNTSGLNTTGPIAGKISWGRLSGFNRGSSPIAIGLTGFRISGLSTYPTVQRRGTGLRDIGALKKIL